MTTETTGLPTGTPTGSAPETSLPAETSSSSAPGSDLATWTAQANSVCQAAISEYQRVKAETGSGNPEGLAQAAALVVTDASNTLASMTAPTAEAEQMTAQVARYAADEQDTATAIRSGSVSDATSAFNHAEVDGKELAATASGLGADQCAAMTTEV